MHENFWWWWAAGVTTLQNNNIVVPSESVKVIPLIHTEETEIRGEGFFEKENIYHIPTGTVRKKFCAGIKSQQNPESIFHVRQLQFLKNLLLQHLWEKKQQHSSVQINQHGSSSIFCICYIEHLWEGSCAEKNPWRMKSRKVSKKD